MHLEYRSARPVAEGRLPIFGWLSLVFAVFAALFLLNGLYFGFLALALAFLFGVFSIIWGRSIPGWIGLGSSIVFIVWFLIIFF